MKSNEGPSTPDKADSTTSHKSDPAIRAAWISAIAIVLAAALTAVGGFISGWLQYRGPGSSIDSLRNEKSTMPLPSRAPVDAGTAPKSKPSTPSGPHSLLDLTPIEQSEDRQFAIGPQTVNTQRYEQTLYIEDVVCYGAQATYQLDRRYRQFRAAIGLNDSSSSYRKLVFTVFVDGKAKDIHTLEAGQTQPITVDLSDAFRMTLDIDGDDLCALHGSPGTGVWIDPVLTPGP